MRTTLIRIILDFIFKKVVLAGRTVIKSKHSELEDEKSSSWILISGGNIPGGNDRPG